MHPPKRPRRSPLVFVFITGVALISIATVLFFDWNYRGNDRSNPLSVHARTVNALASNDSVALYEELSPEMKEFIPRESLIAAQAESTGVVTVDSLESPQIRVETPWNGEWADARVRIVRGSTIEDYLVRYHLENGGWWLYATLKIS